MYSAEHNKCVYCINGYQLQSLRPLSGQCYTILKKDGYVYCIKCQVVWDPIDINVNIC